METITFNQFKNETHHKAVEFVFKPKNESMPSKEFKTDKFYCNKYKGMMSMPRFCLSVVGIWFKISDTEFKFKSEFGETTFKVII